MRPKSATKVRKKICSGIMVLRKELRVVLNLFLSKAKLNMSSQGPSLYKMMLCIQSGRNSSQSAVIQRPQYPAKTTISSLLVQYPLDGCFLRTAISLKFSCLDVFLIKNI